MEQLNNALELFKNLDLSYKLALLNDNMIKEYILETLELLIRGQENLYQNSKKNKIAIIKQLNKYKNEHNLQKKSMDDKKKQLKEIEEYLAAQEHVRGEKDIINKINYTIPINNISQNNLLLTSETDNHSASFNEEIPPIGDS